MDPLEDDIPDDSEFEDEIDDEDIDEDESEDVKEDEDMDMRASGTNVIEDSSGAFLHLDEKKTTPPMMTKYERTMVIGVRAKQLQLGAKSTVDIRDCADEIEIAKKELHERKMPLLIKRVISPAQIEYWRLKDLQL